MKRARVKALLLDQVSNVPVVILEVEGTDRVIPIWIGPCEAYALGMALEGVKTERPLTHDLIFNIMESLDVEIDSVVIHTVKDNTFYAKLILKDLAFVDETGESEVPLIEVDARPSDSMILAVKRGIPIYVSNEVIEEHSIPLFSLQIEGEEGEDEDEKFKKFIENLDIDAFKKFLEGKGEEEEGEEE